MQSDLEYIATDWKLYTAVDTEWKELLSIKADPNRNIYLRDIEIKVSNVPATTEIRLQIQINGEKKVNDLPLITTTTTFRFGGDLILRGKDDKTPIIIRTKCVTSSGADYVSAIVTGVQVEI